MIRFDPLELEDKRAYLYRVIKKYVSHDWGPAVKSQSPPPPQSWELCRQAAYPESNVHFTQSVSQLKDETSLIYA